jgi:alkylhydroperoxidase/carboxymuconolactone decarboxylase family protein YurZ
MYRADRGEREFQNLIGEAPLEALADIRAAWPDMYEAVVTGAFGGTLARPELDRGLREIATVAILAATGGSETQLATHTRAALLQGVAPCELLALCEHYLEPCLPRAGDNPWPRRRRQRAPVRNDEFGRCGWRDRLLERQVLLELLAARHRYPRSHVERQSATLPNLPCRNCRRIAG